MRKITFFDTETTGIPNWKIPSDDVSQPHLTQLGWVTCDKDTREILAEGEIYIKPDGWIIPDVVIDINGITNEMAAELGVPETEALDTLLKICADSERCSHNRSFDQRIIRIALKRYGYGDEAMAKWGEKDDYHDSMWKARKHFGKGCKLCDVHEKLFGEPHEGQHTALADANACMRVWFALEDLNDE